MRQITRYRYANLKGTIASVKQQIHWQNATTKSGLSNAQNNVGHGALLQFSRRWTIVDIVVRCNRIRSTEAPGHTFDMTDTVDRLSYSKSKRGRSMAWACVMVQTQVAWSAKKLNGLH